MDRGLKFHKSKLKYSKSKDVSEYREFYLLDEILHLSGIADRIIIKENRLIIVEHKNLYEMDYIVYGTKMQLIFLAKLAEKQFDLPVDSIEVRTNFGRKINMELSPKNYIELDLIINEIRELYEYQIFPDGTSNSKQCQPCEYRRFCFT